MVLWQRLDAPGVRMRNCLDVAHFAAEPPGSGSCGARLAYRPIRLAHQSREKQGLFSMRLVGRAIARAALGGGLALLCVSSPADAQELSEKSVKTIMDYAWEFTPDRFTRPNGQTIEIDRKNREAMVVPIETAKEVIKVGRLSAHAQTCRLLEEQILNHRSLMKREEAKNTWSPQQVVYINQLHLITVMLLTGKVKLVAKGEGKKEIAAQQSKEPSPQSCTPEQAAKVKEMVSAYVKSGPPVSVGQAKDSAAKPAAAK